MTVAVRLAAASLLLVAVVSAAAAGELPASVEDLLRMSDAEAAAYAEQASPDPALASGARVWRYAGHKQLELVREGEGPWHLVAGVPGDLGPLMLDEVGMARLRARLAGRAPELAKPGLGFVWAGNRITDPETGELKRDVPPSVMVIWPFDRKATGLPGGLQTPASEVRIMLPDTPYAHLIVPVPGVKGLFGESASGQRGDVKPGRSEMPAERALTPDEQPFALRVSLSPRAVTAGQKLEITAEITSRISPHARTSVTLVVDEQAVDELPGALIPPFETATAVFDWAATPGSHALRVEVASAAGVVLARWSGTVDVPPQ